MHFLQNHFYVLDNSPFLSKSNLGNIYSNLLQFALRLWQPLLNFSRSLLCGFNGRFGTVRHKEFSADSGVSNESGFQDIMRCDHGAPLVKKSSTVVYTTCQKSSVVCYLPKVFSGAWCTTWQKSLQWCTTLKVFSGALYLPRVFSGVLSYTSGVLRTSMLTAALN